MSPTPLATPPTPWTPDQPLRADATDRQIEDREEYLCAHHGPAGTHDDCFACAKVAREFASACVAAMSPPPAVTEGTPDTERLDWLSDQRWVEAFSTVSGGRGLRFSDPRDPDHEYADNLRQAIDAARHPTSLSGEPIP